MDVKKYLSCVTSKTYLFKTKYILVNYMTDWELINSLERQAGPDFNWEDICYLIIWEMCKRLILVNLENEEEHDNSRWHIHNRNRKYLEIKMLLPQGIKKMKQENSKDKFVLELHWRLAVTIEDIDVCMPLLL